MEDTRTFDDRMDQPPELKRGRKRFGLFGFRLFLNERGRPFDRDEQLRLRMGELLEVLDDPQQSMHRHMKARREYNKLQAQFENVKLLREHKRLGHRPSYTVAKFIVLYPFCLYAGKLTITGVYDLLWEIPIPLMVYGTIYELVGAYIIRRGVLARSRRGNKSPFAAMAVGLGLIVAGITMQCIKLRLAPHLQNGAPVRTNRDFWHWWVRDANLRHLLLRAWPEGLLGGLYWVLVSWNSGKRKANPHWYNRVMHVLRYAALDDDHPARTWQLQLVPVMVILFALGTTLVLYFGIIIHIANLNAATLSQHGRDILAKLVSAVIADWPTWLIGLVSANFFGRIPAYGPIDDLQQVLAWRRIERKGGSLHGALTMFQMPGYQVRLIREWHHGADQAPAGDDQLQKEAAYDYARDQLRKVDPGVMRTFRSVVYSQWLLIPLGFVFVFVIAKS